jgi:hypothetical protein
MTSIYKSVTVQDVLHSRFSGGGDLGAGFGPERIAPPDQPVP